MFSDDDYIFCASTARTNNIKKLFEVLKEKFTEVQLFVSKEKIAAFHVDKLTNEILSLHLEGKNFDKYVCNQDFILYFEPENLFKVVKTINNDDTLSLYVLKKDPKYLYISALSNVVEDQFEISRFKLLNVIDSPTLGSASQITPVQSLEFPSKHLNNICKDFNNLDAIYIDIAMINKVEEQKGHIKFGCFSTFLDKKDVYIGEMPEDTENSEITQGTFRLGSIKTFVKGINANNAQQTDLILHMGYNFLIISYDISTLGKIQLILESVHPDEIFNRAETYKYCPDWDYILKHMPLEKEYIQNVVEEALRNPSNKYKVQEVNSFIKLIEKYRPDIQIKID